MTQKAWLGVIVLVAALLRGFLLLYLRDTPVEFYSYDSTGYENLALNLLHEGRFSTGMEGPLEHNLWRTPGYPALIALVYAAFGRDPVILILVQVIIGSAGVWLLYHLARAIGLSEWAGLLAAGLFAVEPISVMMTNRILTESSFTTLLIAAVWCVVRYWQAGRWPWLIVSAAAMGVMALTRPISQFLPIALIPAFLVAARRQSWRRCGLACAVWLLVSLSLTYSWAFYNQQTTGYWTLSKIGDLNLYYIRAGAVIAEVERIPDKEARLKLERYVAEQTQEGQLSEAETSVIMRRYALGIFHRYPWQTLKMTVKGTARILADPGYALACTILDRNDASFACFPEGFANMKESGGMGLVIARFKTMNLLQKTVLGWSTLLLILIYASGVIGCWVLFRRRQWLAVMLLLTLIGYFVLLAAEPEVASRFRVPIIPFLAILAAVGLEASWSRGRGDGDERRTRVDTEGSPLEPVPRRLSFVLL
jgi:4-amino-4-deoxy-L-arabinose transferase-like glycosyltransferase